MSASPAGVSDVVAAAAAPQLFVINLCASTSPMALSQPSAPELKRYTFFVSRQREEGRERFRLHMGYFDSQEEAERLLDVVRDVYPAAWAGLAPTSGSRRRTRAAVMPAAVPATAAVPDAIAPSAAEKVASMPVVQPDVLTAMSNVRDVLAQLSDTAVPVLQPAAAPAPAPIPAPAPASIQAQSLELTDSQALSLLESAVPRPAPALPAAAADDTQVRLVTPEDTQTLTDIRLDAQNNAPPCFAVQLVWSVSPIDVASLPHLAIFDAYTLYNVEGNRQGRKWYGVRLGFFSDPNSASQVANYVRSDYRAVAIVPVAIRERDSAAGGAVAANAAPPARGSDPLPKADDRLAAGVDPTGFELLADDRPAPKKLDLDDRKNVAEAVVPVAMPAANAAPKNVAAVRKAAARFTGKPAANAAGKPVGRPTGKRVVVRKRPVQPTGRAAPGAPTPLESTLEILGASTLTLDDSRAIINDSAVRKPVDRKNSGGNRFARLLSRLSGS